MPIHTSVTWMSVDSIYQLNKYTSTLHNSTASLHNYTWSLYYYILSLISYISRLLIYTASYVAFYRNGNFTPALLKDQTTASFCTGKQNFWLKVFTINLPIQKSKFNTVPYNWSLSVLHCWPLWFETPRTKTHQTKTNHNPFQTSQIPISPDTTTQEFPL